MVHRELLIDGHFIGGPCDQATGKEVIRNPYDGSVVGTVAEGGLSELRGCLDAAWDAFQTWRYSPRHERQALLRKIAQSVRERSEELAEMLCDEVGKPIVWSRGEVSRLPLTFDYAADLLSTWGVESLPLDLDPRGVGHRCHVERFPIGPILCIVPYNWPFNLAAHKIAPALATGNTLILKPSPLAPISTLTLARLIHEAGCPHGVINAWNGPAQVISKVSHDPRCRMLSFTGSPAVGWPVKKDMPPETKVTLELGGNASAIVCADADLEWATNRIIAGGYGYAGQVCIAVQHVLVERSVYEETREMLAQKTNACAYGDPRDEKTVCGPMISAEAADKVSDWVDEAVAHGAKIIGGGGREGALIKPVLLEGVPDQVKLANEEVFGPVLTIEPFDKFEEALARVNRSDYGIHTGIFTQKIALADQAFRTLEVGGVIVNDYPTLRFDNMPYGGVKHSGFGREGVRYAMDEMTEPKTMVVRSI